MEIARRVWGAQNHFITDGGSFVPVPVSALIPGVMVAI
jgi:hypothetical protein